MIDERLESEGQRQVAEWVRGLPEDTPGMAWRAALNEKVRAESDRRSRDHRRWTLARPALGLAMASAFALVVIVPHRPGDRSGESSPRSASRVEASLVALHDESVQDADIAGTGLRPAEASASLSIGTDPLDDLDAGVL